MLLINMDNISKEIEAATAFIAKGSRELSRLNGQKAELESQLAEVEKQISDQVNELEKFRKDKEKTEEARDLVLKLAKAHEEEDAHKRMEEPN